MLSYNLQYLIILGIRLLSILKLAKYPSQMFSNMHIQTYLCRMYAKIGQRMTDDVHLKKVFSNPDMVREAKVFEGMLKGLTIQPAESYDNKFCDDVKLLIIVWYSKKQN